jgi:hypothetical protein
MRQMANNEMKKLSQIDSNLPSRIAQANYIILAASWRRLLTFRAGRANVAATERHGTTIEPKKQL